AGLERLIPAEPPILAIELAVRRRADASVAPRILVRLRQLLDLERHFLGDAVHREVADGREALVGLADLLGFERERRVLLDVEEVAAAQVRVALLVARVD